MDMKEVSLREIKRKKDSPLCSLPIRIICEVLLVCFLFVPLLLFVFKWPAAEHLIHGKVLAVSVSCSCLLD